MPKYVHLVLRRHWLKQIESAWEQRTVVWLSGVRRTGKTVLSRSLPDVDYFDCELLRTRRLMEDVESFLTALGEKRIVLDEIHRLTNPSEILKVAAPNVYAFDTGFVCHYRGWSSMQTYELGACWEHYVLNEIQARLQTRAVHYWRDKRRHEVDFVLATGPDAPTAIECEWRADDFDAAGLQAFRRAYAAGDNWVVAHDVNRPFIRRYGEISVRFLGLDSFVRQIAGSRVRPPPATRFKR